MDAEARLFRIGDRYQRQCPTRSSCRSGRKILESSVHWIGAFVSWRGLPEEGANNALRRFIDWVKSSKKEREDGEILMPGEIEEKTKAKRLRDGIELDDITWKALLDTAKAVGATTVPT